MLLSFLCALGALAWNIFFGFWLLP